MQPQLAPYEPSESDRGIPCWNLGTIAIAQQEAQDILGNPHYIETNPFATAGGTEDHWIFLQASHLKLFMRLRVPYSDLDVHVVADTIPKDIWDLFTKLFPGHVQRKLETPQDENRHPHDPAYYYKS